MILDRFLFQVEILLIDDSNEIFICFLIASLDKLPGLDDPAVIKARAEEAARKRKLVQKKKEQHEKEKLAA